MSNTNSDPNGKRRGVQCPAEDGSARCDSLPPSARGRTEQGGGCGEEGEGREEEEDGMKMYEQREANKWIR